MILIGTVFANILLSIVAIGLSAYAIYLTHFKGPIIDLFINCDDNKLKEITLPITRDDEQHFIINKFITGAFINKGNQSGGVIMFDLNSGTRATHFDFQPPVELLTGIAPDIIEDITLIPGQIVPIKFIISANTANYRVHEKDALELLRKTPNLSLTISYKATTKDGFELQKKKIKLKLIKIDPMQK